MEQSEGLSEELRKQLTAVFSHLHYEGHGIWSVYDDEKGPYVKFIALDLASHPFPSIAIAQLREILLQAQARQCSISNTQLDQKTPS